MGVTHCDKCGHVWDAGFMDSCPRCRQMDRDRDELRAAQQSADARHQADMRSRREAEEAADQRHREQLAAAEEDREARYAQARAAREAIAAADDRQRNAPRLIAEGEVQRARKCMEIGDLESSSRHASRAVEADATYAPGRAIRAKVHHMLKEPTASLREAEIAFKLAPNAVANELAEFYPPAAQLMEERRQEKLRADALARTEAEQAQKRREVEQQAATARQAELDRQTAADRQDALTEQWRVATNKMYWSGFGKLLLVSLVAAFILHHRILPLGWMGIVIWGGVAPWVSMYVLTVSALRNLKIESSEEEDEEVSSINRSAWKWTVGSTVGITSFFVVSVFGLRIREVVLWLWVCPLIVALVVWLIRWHPIRRRVATNEAPADFDLRDY